MNEIRVKNLLVFVSILGLLACTPDKPLKREDTWRFSRPEIVMPNTPEGVSRGRLKVGEASQKELSFDSHLAFADSGAQVVLEIDSVCSWNERHFEESFRVRNPETLELGSIVPAQALLELTDQTVECTFDFSAVNEHGSRHHFLVPGVKLASGGSYGSLIVSEKLQRISPAVYGETRVDVRVDDLDQLAIDSRVRSGIAELVCADFTSREQFISADTINWKQLAYKQPLEVLENVLRKFRQPCRLSLKDDSGKRVEISAAFTLLYPAPELEILAHTPPFSAPQNQKIQEISILSLKLVNSSNIEQYLELQNTSADPRLVWTHAEGQRIKDNGFYYFYNIHRTAEISYSVAGSDKVINTAGKTFFSVKAKSEVHVSVLANSYYLNQASHPATHSGYLFLLPQPIRLKRLEVVEDFETAVARSETQVAAEIQIFKMLPHHHNETQIYVPHKNVKANWESIAQNLIEKNFPAGGD